MNDDTPVLKFVPPVPIEERCDFCGDLKTKAEFFCDMPVMKIQTTEDFETCIFTCDKKLCRKCTTRINGFDFCPDCIRKIKSTIKGV